MEVLQPARVRDQSASQLDDVGLDLPPHTASVATGGTARAGSAEDPSWPQSPSNLATRSLRRRSGGELEIGHHPRRPCRLPLANRRPNFRSDDTSGKPPNLISQPMDGRMDLWSRRSPATRVHSLAYRIHGVTHANKRRVGAGQCLRRAGRVQLAQDLPRFSGEQGIRSGRNADMAFPFGEIQVTPLICKTKHPCRPLCVA